MIMVFEKVSFRNCIVFALALAEVTSWTIDLPEVRKFYFEKNAKERKYEDYYKNDGEKRVYYNNIEGNSEHNTKHDGGYEHTAYATEYGYESYMEKKVNNIVYHGSVYLEGLQRALEDFSNFLERCNRTVSNEFTLQNSTRTRTDSINSSREIESSESFTSRCREATKRSEYVRRLSALAMWATRELQDIAYARKYNKGDYHELAKEENELILKLAWFLDRLASFTGYEPEPKDFLEEKERSTTSTTTRPPMFMNPPPSEEDKQALMECIEQNSSVPAVERCRYPGPLPPPVVMLMNMNSSMPSMPDIPAPSNVAQNPASIVPMASESRTPISDQSMEILIASDNRTPRSRLPPILTAIRSVRKRSISSMPQPEVENARKLKRSIEDDPAINFLNYYAKYKIWEGSNPKKPNTKSLDEFEVKNNLPHRQRRAINKKYQHFRLPEDPFQDLSNHMKHKAGVNYVKDETQAEKIREALKRINDKPLSKHEIRKLAKLFRQKRYVKYEKDVDQPRESKDPQGDISYYVKNKPGRSYNYSPVQATQLRAGLQRVFNNPNIEVVRRYGANYNPAIPDPFLFGLMRTLADF